MSRQTKTPSHICYSQRAEEFLLIGALTQPHGIHGEIRVHLFNPESEALFTLSHIWLKRPGSDLLERHELLDAREHTKGVLIRLAGCNTRNHAETLRKTELYIAKDELPQLDEGEFYFYQLQGLPAFSTQGELLGPILQVLPGAAQDLLVLQYQQREVLIPIIDALVPTIDLDKGRVEIEVIPGLLDES